MPLLRKQWFEAKLLRFPHVAAKRIGGTSSRAGEGADARLARGRREASKGRARASLGHGVTVVN